MVAVSLKKKGSPFSLIERPSFRALRERFLARPPGGEKGAGATDRTGLRRSRSQPRSRTALRRKAPRVGERRISSRKSGVARPSRRSCLASVTGAGGFVRLPRQLRAGRRTMPATRGVWSDRGWGEVSRGSNPGRERRGFGDPRPLTLRTFGGCPRSKGDDRSHRQPSRPRIPLVRDVRVVHGSAR